MTDDIAARLAWRVADVSGWPEWMQAPALGHDMTPVVRRVLDALDAGGWEPRRKPSALADARDDRGRYLGKQGTTHEHHSTGERRAWSLDANEWCYPSDPCRLCKEMSE